LEEFGESPDGALSRFQTTGKKLLEREFEFEINRKPLIDAALRPRRPGNIGPSYNSRE